VSEEVLIEYLHLLMFTPK